LHSSKAIWTKGGMLPGQSELQLTRGGGDSLSLCVCRYATGILPDFNMVCKVVKLAMGYIGNSNPREADFYTPSEYRKCSLPLVVPLPSGGMDGRGEWGGRDPGVVLRGRKISTRLVEKKMDCARQAT
jgi:hypothetical protein